MYTPEIVQCCDSHFRRVIYILGPDIYDYPEQCLAGCVVQGWCAKYVEFPSRCLWNVNLYYVDASLHQMIWTAFPSTHDQRNIQQLSFETWSWEKHGMNMD